MVNVSKEQFLADPESCIDYASSCDYVTIRMNDGSAVVMIDECECEMLRQSLAICMEHPEWIAKKN